MAGFILIRPERFEPGTDDQGIARLVTPSLWPADEPIPGGQLEVWLHPPLYAVDPAPPPKVARALHDENGKSTGQLLCSECVDGGELKLVSVDNGIEHGSHHAASARLGCEHCGHTWDFTVEEREAAGYPRPAFGVQRAGEKVVLDVDTAPASQPANRKQLYPPMSPEEAIALASRLWSAAKEGDR